MIPASYFFKDTYRRHWEDAEQAVPAPTGRSFFHGIMTPIAGALDAIFTRADARRHAAHGRHAYD